MKRNAAVVTIGLALFSLLAGQAGAVPVAFPGAEGSGRFATGGRGGTVYEVTNLNNSGAGSIVDAVSQPNRTIVFRVSGTIALGETLLQPKSNTTIAGQTAPGDGICLKGRILLDGGISNIIIRYIRVRVDAGAANSSGDAIDMASCTNVIIDHVTASFARDEGISCRETSNIVTVQWCIISEALTFESHSFGSLVRGDYGDEKTYHHNLYAHNWGRNPRPGNYTATSTDPEGIHFDFRNNVIYNWKGGEPGYNADTTSTSRYNFVGNVSIAGPESSVANKAFKESARDAYAHWSGNAYGASYATVAMPSDQWSLVKFNGFTQAQIDAYKARSYQIPMQPVTTTSWSQALDDVLAGAGAIFPARDVIDTRIVNDVVNGTGHSIAATGEQPEGGWPTLNSLPAPADGDHDGMPDAWETSHGLNPGNTADRNYYTLSTDYTNLEVHINSLVSGEIEPDTTVPTPDPMTWATAPYGTSPTSITMVATTATDTSGVEYFFDCTAGGGHDSAWQDSATYTDTGLTLGITYSYQVKARDKSANHNETGLSSVESASPIADTVAPTPDPMTWASVPSATGIDTITMTASAATDASGVEYFFACTSGGGNDSGWQDSASYTDTGLTNNTTYTYGVIARDKSAGQNATAWSQEASATTIRYECTGTPAMDFNADCKVDFIDYAAIASGWGEESGAVVELITNGDFGTDLSGWMLTPAAPTTITWDNGTALLARNSTAAAANGNYLYQIIPVVSGKQYQIAAQWKGDLLNGGTGRNWAEVYVGFGPSDTTIAGSIMYKKATDGGPNATPMPWNWASIFLSPNTSPVPPADSIFTATDSYMTIAFNLGGRADVGPGYFNVDNVSVMEAGGTACPASDLNDDCAFDWLDIQVFASDWLDCNRNPGSECWQ